MSAPTERIGCLPRCPTAGVGGEPAGSAVFAWQAKIVMAVVMAEYAPSDHHTEPHHRAFVPRGEAAPDARLSVAEATYRTASWSAMVWKNAVVPPAGAHPGML
jgi:hypothetical protein